MTHSILQLYWSILGSHHSQPFSMKVIFVDHLKTPVATSKLKDEIHKFSKLFVESSETRAGDVVGTTPYRVRIGQPSQESAAPGLLLETAQNNTLFPHCTSLYSTY